MGRIKKYTDDELKVRNAESRKRYYHSEKGIAKRKEYREALQMAYRESKIILTDEEKLERRRQSRIKYYNRLKEAKSNLNK